MSQEHRPVSEAELAEMERRARMARNTVGCSDGPGWQAFFAETFTPDVALRIIAEVRRQREALISKTEACAKIGQDAFDAGVAYKEFVDGLRKPALHSVATPAEKSHP